MFIKTPGLDPVIRDDNSPRTDCIYFALKDSKGWLVPEIKPWSWTLHVVINPATREYNDQITADEWQINCRPIGTITLPDDGLNELVRLSTDAKYLSLAQGKVYRSEVCDGDSETVESYINGEHKKLWCYSQLPLFDGIIDLKSRSKYSDSRPFETGLDVFGPLVKPVVDEFYEAEHQRIKDDCRARKFVEEQTWKFAKTMPQIPHYYCLKGMCSDPKEFEWFVDCIVKYSTAGQFYGRTYNYYFLDDWKYWIMDEDPAMCNLINREFQNKD